MDRFSKRKMHDQRQPRSAITSWQQFQQVLCAMRSVWIPATIDPENMMATGHLEDMNGRWFKVTLGVCNGRTFRYCLNVCMAEVEDHSEIRQDMNRCNETYEYAKAVWSDGSLMARTSDMAALGVDLNHTVVREHVSSLMRLVSDDRLQAIIRRRGELCGCEPWDWSNESGGR